MNRTRYFAAALLLASTNCLRAQEPMGQFGAYHWRNAQLRLPDNTALTVYRVKYWTFDAGQPPALQLEFESPSAIADTAAVHRMAIRIWPAFAPYVEHVGVSVAIITATNLTRHGAPPLPWTAEAHSFGFVVHRDAVGHWYMDDDRSRTPLPPSLSPTALRIYDASGKRMVLLERPTAK